MTKPHRSKCLKCKDKAFVFCQCPTYPVKQLTLTDAEIDYVWFNYGWGEVEKEDLNKFARAILRKAQEK